MTEIDRLVAANEDFAGARERAAAGPEPRRRLALVACMDARIDVLATFGLHLGDAQVLRNAGGRVTDDVLRSLALSCNLLGVDSVVVMQHTMCRLADITDEELREQTGADLEFLPIADHATTLRDDVELLRTIPYLAALRSVAGFLYDTATGRVTEICRWDRAAG
jgi:carbonic anhydrase